VARVLVIGAGVSGLTCGVRLLEEGHDVEIWARAQTPNTTSDVAAAVWYPLRGTIDERVARWLKVSYERFTTLAEQPSTGILLRGGIELLEEPEDDAKRLEVMPRSREARPDELPSGYASGYIAEEIPLIEMPIYLRWLTARLRSLGGEIVTRDVSSFDEAFSERNVVVNCTGLGARELANDESMQPIRGQVVRVAQVGLERYILDEQDLDEITYIYPRSSDIVLGGTREVGIDSTDLDAGTARAIMERCVKLEPRLENATIVSQAAGLRPGRPSVRLESEHRSAGLLVHDYGHGGSGVTLSWGCAEEVVSLISVAPETRSSDR
jgi:D-amino-acid oxidase